MRTVALVPDGVGVRNLVLGPFLDLATEAGECLVLHAVPASYVDEYRAGGSAIWSPLEPDPESLLRRLLRNTLLVGQMRWADTVSMRLKLQRRPTGRWRHRLLEHTSRLLSRGFAHPERLQWLDRRHCNRVAASGAVDHYRKLFREWQPDVIVCSHHRPTNVIAPVLAAHELGVPTATLIFSWDNLTSKGRIVAPFDHYLVWSQRMRDELLRFYPEIDGAQVHVVGTPQFDPYARATETREAFFQRFGGDPARPLLCYSGGDVGTCPEDAEHARIVLEIVSSGKLDGPRGRPQVLVRPAPVDTSGRYLSLQDDFPDVFLCQPEWADAGADWSVKLPTAADIDFLRHLVVHTDVGINLASTMTLDFALHDTPVVNVAFDVADPPPFGRPLWEHYYRYDHYRPVVEIGAARFARSRAALETELRRYLDDPSLDAERRRQLVDLQVGIAPGQCSPRLVSKLSDIASRAI